MSHFTRCSADGGHRLIPHEPYLPHGSILEICYGLSPFIHVSPAYFAAGAVLPLPSVP